MNPKRPSRAAAMALLLAALLVAAPATAQERPVRPVPEAGQERDPCLSLAEAAVKSARAEVDRRKPAEVQARLPELLARFAAQPGLEAALGCQMRRQTAE